MKPPIEYRPKVKPPEPKPPLFKAGDVIFKPTFDRKAYQREYMRKRRSAKRNVTP